MHSKLFPSHGVHGVHGAEGGPVGVLAGRSGGNHCRRQEVRKTMNRGRLFLPTQLFVIAIAN